MIEAIDLRRLHVLRMVDTHGTVTAAAEALHLTPSAVSHQLRQLARDVGLELLERDGRGVRLTPAGQRLVVHADDLHAAWEEARADLQALEDGTVGALRLAGFPTAVAALLAPAAAQLAIDAPGLEVHVAEIDVDVCGAVDRLLSGAVDVAVVAPADDVVQVDGRRVGLAPLLAEPLDLVVARDHPLATASAPVPLASVADERWVLAGPDNRDCHQLVVAACTAAGFAPRVVHEARTPMAVAALVARHLGITLAPRLAPLGGEGVVRIPLAGDPPPRRRLFTCVRRGTETQPATARALAVLRDVADQLPGPTAPVVAAVAG